MASDEVRDLRSVFLRENGTGRQQQFTTGHEDAPQLVEQALRLACQRRDILLARGTCVLHRDEAFAQAGQPSDRHGTIEHDTGIIECVSREPGFLEQAQIGLARRAAHVYPQCHRGTMVTRLEDGFPLVRIGGANAL